MKTIRPLFVLLCAVCALYLACGTPPVIVTPPTDNLPSVVASEYESDCRIEGDIARFSSVIKLAVLKDGWTKFTLLPDKFSVTDFSVATGEADSAQLLRTETGYDILLGKKGQYVVNIGFIIRVKESKSGRSVTVPFMAAVKNAARIRIPEKDLKISVSPAVNYGTDLKGDDSTEVFMFGSGAGEAELTWQSALPDKSVKLTMFAEQRCAWTVSRGSVLVNSSIQYNILQGVADSFSVEISSDLNILDVTGQNIKKWDLKDAEGRKVLVVTLSSPATKYYALDISGEKIIDGIPASLSAIKIVPLEVERERGFIAISSRSDIKTEVSSAKEISQIDDSELPPGMAPKGSSVLGFRYLKRPFELVIAINDVTAKVTAETVSVATFSKDAVRLSVNIFYTIRENGVFRFSVKLDEGLRLMDITGADINNWQIKGNILIVDLRSKAEKSYVLRLELEKLIKDPSSVTVPTVEPLDVERERGYLCISSTPGIKSEVIKADNASQMNVNEIAPFFAKDEAGSGKNQEETLKALAPKYPIESAFRYLKRPFSVTVAVSDIMPEISAEVLTLYTIEEKKLGLDAEIILTITKAGVFGIKIHVPKELRVITVDGLGVDDWKKDDEKETLSIVFNSKVEGVRELRIQVEKQLENVEAGLVLPRIQILDIKKEKGFLAVVADTGLRAKADLKNMAKLSETDIKDLPERLRRKTDKAISLGYKYFEHPWEAPVSIEKIKPYITAETFSFFSLGDELLNVSSTVKYGILYAGTSEFTLKFPKGVKNVDIQGDNIKQKDETKDPEGDSWKIVLHAPKMGEYRLFVTFQKDIKESSPGKYENVGCEGVQVMAVERETGFVALSVRSDLEVIMGGEGKRFENLTIIDEREIPGEYMTGITVPILLAGKYIQHNYAINFDVAKHEFAEVLVAIIEGCMLYSTVSHEGELITDLVCAVRNSKQQQYLEVALPTDAKIWHLFVGTDSESALEKMENGKKICAIPIAKEKRGDEAFTVRLRYSQNAAPLGKGGKLALACPQLNMPAMRVGWMLSFPDGYEVVSDSGNMKRVGPGDMDQMLRKLTPEIPKEEAREQQVNAPQGNLVQTNMNSIASSNIEMGSYSTGKGGGSSTRGIYTGGAIRTGNSYFFQTLIAMNKQVGFELRYVKSNAGLIIKGFLALLIAALLLLAWFKVAAIKPSMKLGAFVLLFLVLVSLQTLAETSYYEYYAVLAWTTAVIVLILLVLQAKNALMNTATADGPRIPWRRKPAKEEPKTETKPEIKEEEKK